MTPIITRIPLVSFKSHIGVEIRRFRAPRDQLLRFDEFLYLVKSMHQLNEAEIRIYYLDQQNEALPIDNDVHLAKAIEKAGCIRTSYRLRDVSKILRKISMKNHNDFDIFNNRISQLVRENRHYTEIEIMIERPLLKLVLEIKNNPQFSRFVMKNRSKGAPEDFRQVSSIIDADILPHTRRRVVLKRGDSDRPLGFYIRDGTYQEMNADGIIEKNYGIFIGTVMPGGLADSTNLLAENDEILEVNGVEVGKGKRLEQVRDMIVANFSNLILTTRPAKSINHCYYRHNRFH